MKIAFLGDSITLGYALENKEQDRFSGLVCRELGAEEMNLGITGTLIAKSGMSASDGTSFLDRLYRTAGCDFAVVFGGTNDYFWGDTPIEAPKGIDTESSEADKYFRTAVRKLLCGLLAMYPPERILVITPYPHHGIGNYRGAPDFRASREHDTDAPNILSLCLEDYADALREEAGRAGVLLLDLHTMYGNYSAGFDWRRLTSDGCHPNAEGHKWLAGLVTEKIKEQL